MKFIIFLSLFLVSICSWSDTCETDQSVCSFYCRKNEELHCKKTEYLMDYGYKYCRLFIQNNKYFSPSGQKVLAKIRKCLVESLSEEKDLSCQNVKMKASESHAACYTSAGFCRLSLHDQSLILWMIRAKILDHDFFSTLHQIANVCWNNSPKKKLN